MTSFLSFLAGLLLAVGGPVTGLSIQPAPERTEVVISMEGQAEYRDFTMEGMGEKVFVVGEIVKRPDAGPRIEWVASDVCSAQ